MTEHAYIILLLTIGAELVNARPCEARFLGMFLALFGAMVLLIKSIQMATGGLMAVIVLYGVAKHLRCNNRIKKR